MSKTGFCCAFCGEDIGCGPAWLHGNGSVTHVECKVDYTESLYPYDCPKCEGTGRITFAGLNWSPLSGGWELLTRSEEACPLCGGKGKLKHKPVPTDWKLEVEDD